MSDTNDTNLDAPIWGAEKIALAAGLVHPDGTANVDAFYYKTSQGYLAVAKCGGRYVTTLRKIRDGLLNNPNKTDAA
jgi:hypothetical protein